MRLASLFATATLAAAIAAPASAAVVFTSTFENVPGGPAQGQFKIVSSADGWTGNPNIELQNRVAGNPAPTGGNVFIELDTNSNSSMFRTIGAGTYNLSYLYSPRPRVGNNSNGIEVLLNGVSLSQVAQQGQSGTKWSTININRFNATAGSVLTFRATGTSDSLGGYVDNITLTAVPEPATWAMLILGFGVVGGALRRSAPKRVGLHYA